MVDVVEAYKDYAPPSGTLRTAQVLLETVSPKLLVGLRRVVLTNSRALSGARKRARSFARGRKVRHADQAAGLYHQEWHGEPAWIEIFVDKALARVPRWLLRLEFSRTVLLGGVLYHELGHHIHKTCRPEYAEREGVADRWARRLLRQHARDRHPVMIFLLTPVARMARSLRRLVRRRHPIRG